MLADILYIFFLSSRHVTLARESRPFTAADRNQGRRVALATVERERTVKEPDNLEEK